MNIQNRLKKIEAAKSGKFCRCPGNEIATSKEVFDAPDRCADCRGIVQPSVLVVSDLLEVENFNHPVKIYAGFDANLV